MGEYGVAFAHPAWLWWLLLIPAMAWIALRRKGALGGFRGGAALILRSLVVLMVAAALADVQIVRSSDRVTTFFLLDRSRSIPERFRRAMLAYVNLAVETQRRDGDRAGVIVFGKTAAVESPPLDFAVELREPLGALRGLDANRTDLASAVKLALASFPEDSSKRIVLLSDGNQNLGDVAAAVRQAAEAGVGVDVVPVDYDFPAEILVESLTSPADVRKDEPFELKAVLNNTGAEAVRGRIVFSRERDGRLEELNPGAENQAVEIPPGKKVYTLQQKLAEPNFYRFRVRFEADDPRRDPLVENNVAHAITQVAGAGRILLVENADPESRGQHEPLAQRLRRQGLEVLLRTADQGFQSKVELQQFDAVVLGDVPREQFTEEQIDMLVESVHDTGCGLVMLGGPNSFGAGGWANTKLETAMPVDFQIKAAQVVPRGALVLVMHASEMAMGNHWQKVVAKEAVKALSPQDYCGLVYWMGNVNWLWKRPIGLIPIGAERGMMLAGIDRMVPGDMPDFDPSLRMAADGFARVDKEAGVKHAIVISDGDPSPPTAQVVARLKALNVTVTTVAVGSHGLLGNQVMQDLANKTGGKYYVVNNGAMLPAIYQKEARRVARPLVYESLDKPFPVQVVRENDLVRGFTLGEELPPITGYVMTTKKSTPLVEVSILAPVPAGQATEENRTILAHWRFGLGRTAALTTDAGQRWASTWTGAEKFDRLLYQIVQATMRPTGDARKYSIATRVEDGKVKVIVTALDAEGRFVNLQTMSMTVLRPEGSGKSEVVPLQQESPGRYAAEFPAEEAGSYVLAILPGPNEPLLRTGVDIPYSEEFRVRSTNLPLLRRLAESRPARGAAGIVIESTPPKDITMSTSGAASTNAAPGPAVPEAPPAAGGATDLPTVWLSRADVFRKTLAPASSGQDAWHWFVFAGACLFFVDVLQRRVVFSTEWLQKRLAGWRKGTPAPTAGSEFLDRLRERKQEVDRRLEEARESARRPEPPADGNPSERRSDALPGAPPGPSTSSPGGSKPASAGASDAPSAPPAAGESYAERLLKAKKKVWDDRKEGGGGPPR